MHLPLYRKLPACIFPPGFEVIAATDDDHQDGPPRMNNCGQILWSKRIEADTNGEAIFLWDNGTRIQITDNDVRDALKDKIRRLT